MSSLQLEGRVCENASLKKYSYVRLGGRARWLAFPKHLHDLKELMSFIQEESVPYFILGNGSNVLFSDDMFEGVVIALHEFESSLEFKDDLVICKGHVMLDRLINESYRKGLSGFECLVGIPATVAGSVFNNTGTPRGEICHQLESLTYLSASGECIALSKDEMEYAYRKGPLQKDQGIILETYFYLQKDDPEKIKARMKEVALYRKETQPLGLPSLGCVFKNPSSDVSASQLIDQCGLKGLSLGGVSISEKHASFMIHDGSGTAEAYRLLIEKVQSHVLQKTGISLELEIEWVRG